MRIDEFSSASDFNGSFSPQEQRRFILLGFDLTLEEYVEEASAVYNFIQPLWNFNFLAGERK